MTRHAVFLKGINVGAKNALPMADLRAWLEEDGFTDVRTYVQSGNVVLDGHGSSTGEVEERVHAAIASRHHRPIVVTARTRAQLKAVVDRDPLGDVADDPARYWVGFCTSKPAAAPLRELLERDFGRERLAAHGTELYGWSPDGLSGGELTKAVGKAKLGCDMTVRNWRTTCKVLAMLEA